MKRILLSIFSMVIIGSVNAQTISCDSAHTRGSGAATVTGIIINGAEFGTSTRYIQDATGGLALYGSALSSLNRGDSATITGTLSPFSGLLELGTPTINSSSAGHTLPTPLAITAATGFAIANEGMLVRLNNVTFTSTGTFAGSTNYNFTQGSTTEDVRINTASNLVGTTIPSGSVDIVGVLSENASSGGATVFQLLLRDINDIIYHGNPPVITTPLLQTNITQTSFTVSFNTQNQGSTIIHYGTSPTNLNMTTSSLTMTTAHSQNLTGLSPATIYYVQGISVSSTNDTSKSAVTAMATVSTSSGDIKIYFNNPVDVTKAQHGHVATYLNNSFADTLIAYINRTASSLDIAIYNLDNNLGIITAVNAATTRGVNVRVICDAGVSSSVFNLFTTTNKIQAPAPSTTYGIMHNKFAVMDVGSPSMSTVLTGSTNWGQQEMQQDKNNMVIIQDQSLAKGYTAEFNEMFTGNLFGASKSNNTPHEYVIGGKRIEQYFSPSDGVNAQIMKHIATANYDFYSGLEVFTFKNIAYTIVDSAYTKNGAFCAGIVSDSSQTNGGAVFTELYNYAGGKELANPTPNGILFHHKYGIIDPNDACSDPTVITGSHNWSSSADTKNDENILMIHDSTIANLYYQEFAQRFVDYGGTLTAKAYKSCGGGTIGINEINRSITAQLFPNPSQANTTVMLNENAGNKGFVSVCDITGKELMHINFNNQTKLEIPSTNLFNGIYLVNINTEKGRTILKWVLSK